MNQQHASDRTRAPVAAPLRFAPTLLTRSLQAAFVVIAATAVVGTARANPQGGVVVGGQATISQPSPALTTIQQSSQRAVIDWRSFSIGSGEAVRFNQPGPTAAVLNRVTGNDPSSLLGSLSANGRVYLVNQNGVFIGPNAQLDAAALVLSTANISNSDFMAGKLNFDQPGKPGAKIVNEGRITAADGGLVAMVAPGVENRGVISAKLGQVVLAGAPAFSLDLFGDGMVNIVLTPTGMGAISDATGRPLANYVDNSGKVTADGGRIWISAATARGLVDGMVNISGELKATRVAQQGGEITLLGGNTLTVNGNVTATSADGKGGSIAASADAITLASNAVLDASGSTGGGTVLVGGGYQGKSAVPGAVTTAGSLRVAEGAQVKVDATGNSGNGGLAVLWSDNDTRFSGGVSARAGTAGGDGGLMEVSGKKYLAFDGTADGRAPAGLAGTLLLDPGSLTVADAGAGGFSASGADSTVGAGTISNVLRGGTSVALLADDNITINSQIDARALPGRASAAGAGLTLDAGGAVVVNKSVVLNGGSFESRSARGGFSQLADTAIASLNPDGTFANQSIKINATGGIQTQYLLTTGNVDLRSDGGSIVASQVFGGVAGGALQPIGALSAVAVGQVTIAGVQSSGNVVAQGRDVLLGQVSTGGRLDVPGAGNNSLTLTGSLKASGIGLGDATTSIGALSMNTAATLDAGAGGVTVRAARIDSLGSILSSANVSLAASAGGITLGKIEAQGMAGIDVLARDTITVGAGGGVLTHGGNVALRSTVGGIVADATIAANDPPSAGASAAAANKLDLRAAGDIVVRQLIGSGDVSVVSEQGSISFRESLGGVLKASPAIGRLTVAAGRDVTTNGLNLAGGAGTGLSIDVGTLGNGGVLRVNDRIGVTAGDMLFGSQIRAGAYRADLYQGVYGRSGQNITFNVPVVAHGDSIVSGWSNVADNKFLDMVLIPRQLDGWSTTADELATRIPSTADRLVTAGGGLQVRATAGGDVTSVCPVGGCDASLTDVYWMVPKIVISNQDDPARPGAGRIQINSGYALGSFSTNPSLPSAAIKFIVPSSDLDTKPVSFAGRQVSAFAAKNFASASSCGTPRPNECTGSVQVGMALLDFGSSQAPIQNYRLASTSPQVNGTRPFLLSDAFVQDSSFSSVNLLSVVGPISLTVFPGGLASETARSEVDTTHVLPSGLPAGFNSNSTPSGFQSPGVTRVGQTNLSQQLNAALGSGGEVDLGNGNGNGNFRPGADPTITASAQTLEKRSKSAHSESTCGDIVVGRSRGDEADTGAVTALRGASRRVFKTSYALGSVATTLPAADGESIAGGSAGTACR